MGLERDFLAEGQVRSGVLGVVALGLALLRTVDAVETDALRVLVVQDFDGVAVKYGDDGAGEVSGLRAGNPAEK